MDFSIRFLSFFVLQPDEAGSNAAKTYKHYRTLDEEAYANSEIRRFLDGEFARICKRKVEKNPNTEQAPTKIGRFVVEPGYELDSNPNYNLFQRLRLADNKEYFLNCCDEMVRIYMDTSAVRGGAFIVASARLPRYFDEPFIFVMKCDFEPKVARISDEQNLIAQVDMAISARNMKSIQFPFMPEEGMLEESELKIHQASHARYFEDFLKYVSYEKSMPEIVSEQVLSMVHSYMEQQRQQEGSDAVGGRDDGARIGNGNRNEETLDEAEYVAERAESREQRYEDGMVQLQDHDLNAGFGSTGDGEEPHPQSGLTAQPSYSAAGLFANGHDQGYEPRQTDSNLEMWAARDKRDLQETWAHAQVMEAAMQLADQKQDLELKFKLDGINVKGLLTDYGNSIHIARHNGRYVVVIEGDQFEFEKGISPVELLKPEELDVIVRRIGARTNEGDGSSPPWQ